MLIANRYEATGNASWGGMAEVLQFVDTHLNRPVMLKRMCHAADASRLVDEQKALLSVRSKHVVQLLDIVEYDYRGENERGLILEHIDGADLAEGSFQPNLDFVSVLWQIASGLADIHAAGVIHRDIKPSNIRLDSTGVIKIIDFGLSRQVGVDDKTMSVIGSFGYIAPELQGGAGPIRFSQAVDVFAFGATALALLVPVANQSGVASPALATQIMSSADKSLTNLISPCLNPDPLQRPMVLAIRDALAAILLNGRHRAWLNNEGKLTEINAQSPYAKINAGVGSIEIDYSGTQFVVRNVAGAVSINNMLVLPGQPMPSSCVIIFGAQGARSRAFVTFDSSNPEVMA